MAAKAPLCFCGFSWPISSWLRANSVIVIKPIKCFKKLHNMPHELCSCLVLCRALLRFSISEFCTYQTIFPSYFKFDGNLIPLPFKWHFIDRYEVLNITRQLCCRDMCKIFLRNGTLQWSYTKTNIVEFEIQWKNRSWSGPQAYLTKVGEWCYEWYGYTNHMAYIIGIGENNKIMDTDDKNRIDLWELMI